MRRIILTLISLAFAATCLSAQTMNIHKKDGSVVTIALSEIDHIDYGSSSITSSSRTNANTQTLSVLQDPGTMQSYRGKNGNRYSFRVTGKGAGRFWGGQDLVYTDDSPLAVAAVHAGLLDVGETGIVTVIVLPGRSSYPTLTRNGLTSISYGSYAGSYQFVKD